MSQRTFEFDNRAGIVNRDETYQRILSTLPEARRAVLHAVEELGAATSKEVAKHLGRPLNAISGRFSELSDTSDRAFIEPVVVDGVVVKREGCVVYRVKP